MPLNANALTTYAAVLDDLELEEPADESERSRLQRRIERAINAASAAIVEYCHREFARGVVTEKLTGGGVRLVVARRPVLAVSAFSFGGVALPLDALEIEDAEAGILLVRRGLPAHALAGFGVLDEGLAGFEPPDYSVTYEGGYTLPNSGAGYTLPATVEEACIMTATTAYHSRGENRRVASESLPDYSVQYVGANSAIGRGLAGIIPDEAAAALANYVIPVM